MPQSTAAVSLVASLSHVSLIAVVQPGSRDRKGIGEPCYTQLFGEQEEIFFRGEKKSK